jgi:hypothetical protein
MAYDSYCDALTNTRETRKPTVASQDSGHSDHVGADHVPKNIRNFINFYLIETYNMLKELFCVSFFAKIVDKR